MKKYRLDINYTPDHIFIDPDYELSVLLPDDLVTKLKQSLELIKTLPEDISYVGITYAAPGVYLDETLWEDSDLETWFTFTYFGYFEVYRNEGITYTVIDKNGEQIEFQLYLED